MSKLSTSLSTFLSRQWLRSLSHQGGFYLVWGLTAGICMTCWGQGQPAQADTPDSAPAGLKAALTQIDSAANSRNPQAVSQFYSPNFTNSDGLNRQTLTQSLTQLWQRYPDLKYRTELKSWKAEQGNVVAETITQIRGTQKVDGRELRLESVLRSRQRFEGQQIVRQEILAERSQITVGAKPPTVKFNLPEQVNVGQEFSFDAIVQEPLGSDLLLGNALEEPVQPSGYLNPTTTDLELLPAGGLFKVGRAPNSPGSRWISAVIVREGGMTMVTQRLQIIGQSNASSSLR